MVVVGTELLMPLLPERELQSALWIRKIGLFSINKHFYVVKKKVYKNKTRYELGVKLEGCCREQNKK